LLEIGADVAIWETISGAGEAIAGVFTATETGA
jgi:hypothetical protein